MTGFGAFGRIVAGLFALLIVAYPPLSRIKLEDEAAECAKRRAAITANRVIPASQRVCPRDRIPYNFVLTPDSTVAVRCQNGHDETPLPLHEWVSIR